MAALNVLDQLIAAQPESVKPVLAHISGMFKSSQLAFDSHVGENESIFGQVQVQISAQADRLSEVEKWAERASKQGTELRERVDKLEAHVSEAVSQIGGHEQKVQVLHDVVNALGQSIMGLTSNLEAIKAHSDAVDAILVDMPELEKLQARTVQIEKLLNSTPSAGWVGGAPYPGSYKEQLREITKFGNKSTDDFRHWQESVKDLMASRPNGIEALTWAAEATSDISVADVRTASLQDISIELWQVLGMKTLDAPWRMRLSVPGQNGLEHWRRLSTEYNPQSPSQAAVLARQLLALPESPPEQLIDTMSRVDAAILEHDKMAEIPMSEDIRKAVFEKICPSEWLTAMRLAGQDVSTATKLRSRMALYIRGGKEQAKLKSISATGVTSMDLGGFSVPPARETSESNAQSDAILKAITDMGNSLAAFVAGKGAPRHDNYGGGGGKGPQQPRPDKNGKGRGKGKGKGKGADMRPGTRVCHAFSETGRCPHQEKYGYCKFKHVRGVPKSLAAVEGLRFEDLGQCTYSPKEDIYTCVPGDLDEKTLASQIAAEVEEISKEIAELEEFNYSDASTFTRH